MPVNIEDFMKIRETSIIEIKEAKDEGQKVVGIYCTFCPQEMVLAAGAIPVSLCGTSEKPIPAAEEVLPRNLCPLIKSSYGFAATDTCPFFHFSDLVIGETTCDGKKKMFELMQDIKPVHVMQLPHLHQLDAALELWIKELRRLRSTLEEELGVEISDEKLWEAIHKVNQETAAVKAICDLNKGEPVLSGMDLLTVTWSKNFSTDKDNLLAMLKALQEELTANRQDPNSRKPRVLLTGCPVGLGSEKVIHLVEEAGGCIVAMENCSGYKTLELQTDTELDDPIVALAQKYMKIPCSCMSPNPYRLQLLQQMIEEFKIDAVVDLTWQACHTYNIEAFEVGKLVKNNGLPYLHLESDYSSSDLETLKIRIEALLEMVS
jgi:benzoyl-CoA reductase/2-hydroxyglutaryl-CoA dehydratase subunit BcrC/BadD/HgdB